MREVPPVRNEKDKGHEIFLAKKGMHPEDIGRYLKSMHNSPFNGETFEVAFENK